jgi:hypothetical protein
MNELRGSTTYLLINRVVQGLGITVLSIYNYQILIHLIPIDWLNIALSRKFHKNTPLIFFKVKQRTFGIKSTCIHDVPPFFISFNVWLIVNLDGFFLACYRKRAI